LTAFSFLLFNRRQWWYRKEVRGKKDESTEGRRDARRKRREERRGRRRKSRGLSLSRSLSSSPAPESLSKAPLRQRLDRGTEGRIDGAVPGGRCVRGQRGREEGLRVLSRVVEVEKRLKRG
jgi:hypothetical protein